MSSEFSALERNCSEAVFNLTKEEEENVFAFFEIAS